MFAQPPDAIGKCGGIIGRHDKAAHAVLDNLGHAGDAGADYRPAASHPFEQRLPEQFRHTRLVSIHRAIDARQHDAQRPAICLDQFRVIAIVPKAHAFARGQSMQVGEESFVGDTSNDFQLHRRRHRGDEIVDALVRQNASGIYHRTVTYARSAG